MGQKEKAENDLIQVREANAKLKAELEEKSAQFETKTSDYDLLSETNVKNQSEVQELKTEIQKIDSKNRELVSKMEELKVETIKERNQQNEKFETDKQKLIEIANQLEVAIELKSQLALLTEKHESLTKEFEKENLNSEK